MNIVIAPDNRLRVKTKPVKKITPGLLQKFKDMIKLTKSFVDPEGVGLASTQVGEEEQYFVAKMPNDKFKAFINPKILKTSKTTKKYFEGCLSIPKYWGEVDRYLWLDVSYLTQSGEEIKERIKGTTAWIFQHECDHLNGVLFIDKVLTDKSRMFKVTGKDRAGNDIFEEIAI